MAYSDTLIGGYQTPLSVAVLAPSDFWTRSHPLMKAAGYVTAGLIGLAVVPALFMSMDHDAVVRLSNSILDFVS